MKSQPRRRSWTAGALRAGRAAAFLTVVTGVNGVIAAVEPRYEPIYVYLAAIVIVAWLGGALLGVTVAVAAVVIYDTMFAPIAGMTPSWSSVVPFVVAIGAALVTQLARAPVARSHLPVAAPPPLLETTRSHVVSVTPAVDAAELADLREQLASAGRQLEEARALAERESRLRIESSATARARLAGIQHDLDGSRNDALEQAKRAATLHGQLDELTRRDSQSTAQVSALERELKGLRERTAELEIRMSETVQELEVAWRRVDEEKGRSEAEARRLQELEKQANDALQTAVADLASRYEGPLAEAKERLADAFTRIPVLEKDRDAFQAEAQHLRDRAGEEIATLNAQVGTLQQQLLDAAKESEAERAKHEQALSEVEGRIASITAGVTSVYEVSLGQTTAEKEAARAEIESLTARVETLQQQLADAAERAETERVERERLQAEVDQRIATITAGLTSNYEASLGQTAAEKEAARGEIGSLTARVETLQQKLVDAAARAEAERVDRERLQAEVDQRIASIAAGLTSDYEESLGQAMLEKEGARAEVRLLTKKLELLQKKLSDAAQRAEDERVERERLQAEVDSRIASIASGLTSDYEESLGQAMLEKEGARAEVRSLTSKLDALKESVADYSVRLVTSEARAASLLVQMERLAADVENERSRTELERAERDRITRDFDRKITSIVAGITNDHEHAIGEAVVEREAARAELRSTLKKLEAEKKRADDEKSAREKLDAEWGEKLQTIVNHLASDHESDIGEKMMEKEAARAEARDLGIRLKSTQQKLELEREQHRQTLQMLDAQRTSAAPPPPSTPRTAVVLVVHSDAGMRAMSKHALEQSGYTVITAADGLEALRMASSERPEVVIAEAILPKMNGRELIQLMKARAETAAVKVVLVTSSHGTNPDRGSDFQADDVLDAPIDFNKLRASLAKVLGT